MHYSDTSEGKDKYLKRETHMYGLVLQLLVRNQAHPPSSYSRNCQSRRTN